METITIREDNFLAVIRTLNHRGITAVETIDSKIKITIGETELLLQIGDRFLLGEGKHFEPLPPVPYWIGTHKVEDIQSERISTVVDKILGNFRDKIARIELNTQHRVTANEQKKLDLQVAERSGETRFQKFLGKLSLNRPEEEVVELKEEDVVKEEEK